MTESELQAALDASWLLYLSQEQPIDAAELNGEALPAQEQTT